MLETSVGLITQRLSARFEIEVSKFFLNESWESWAWMIERVRRERTRAKAKGPSERRPIIYACLSARAPRTTHSVLDKRGRETHDDDVSRDFVHFRPLERLPWRIRERMNRMLNGIRIILLTLLLQRDFSTMISERRWRRGILYREPAPITHPRSFHILHSSPSPKINFNHNLFIWLLVYSQELELRREIQVLYVKKNAWLFTQIW